MKHMRKMSKAAMYIAVGIVVVLIAGYAIYRYIQDTPDSTEPVLIGEVCLGPLNPIH